MDFIVGSEFLCNRPLVVAVPGRCTMSVITIALCTMATGHEQSGRLQPAGVNVIRNESLLSRNDCNVFEHVLKEVEHV